MRQQVAEKLSDVQVRLCLNCGAPIVVWANSRKVYCSQKCRSTASQRRYRKRKREKDPAWAQAEFERLLRWKEEHSRKIKQARSDDLA